MENTTRRTFLKTLPGLGAGALLPTMAGTSASSGNTRDIREEAYTFDDHGSLMECRNALFSRFAWIPSDVQRACQIFTPFREDRTAWLLWKDTAEGPRLVDYQEFRNLSEYRHLPSQLPPPGFVAWLDAYVPRGLTDVAVAMTLYREHLFGKRVDPARLRFEPHPRVDAYLRPTRGMILWSSQITDLIDMVVEGGSSPEETRKLMGQFSLRNELIRRPERSADIAGRIDQAVQSRLAGMRIDGCALLEIIDERLVFKDTVCRPDYRMAERLEFVV